MHPGHIVASLDKMLYDDYLCLVALNKQQIQVERSQTLTGKLKNSQLPKQVWIHSKDSAIVTFSQKEDNDASINQRG